MGDRLTDEELDAIEGQCDGLGLVALSASAQRDVRLMIAELRERRARDLTGEDVEALEFARWRLIEYPPESGSYVVRTKRALAALSKLLTRGNR